MGKPLPGNPALGSSVPLSLPSIPLIPASVAVAGNTLQLATTSTTMAPLSASAATKSTGATEPKPKQAPYRVATSIVPIPGKLVKRIQALEYVDMREVIYETHNTPPAGKPFCTGCEGFSGQKHADHHESKSPTPRL